MEKPRQLFTDGWNSFWHFVFGFIALYNIVISVLFILYQLYDYNDKNLFVDLFEFLIGYTVAVVSYVLILGGNRRFPTHRLPQFCNITIL